MDPNFKRTLILENYEKPFHRGLVDDSTYLKENKNNSSCIDNFDIQLKMNDNKIEDIRFEGEACAIAVSSASISIQKLIGKTKEEAHREFFEETLKCVQTFDCFNCLGHLDYIMRYGPYEDKHVEHELYQDIIDEILKTLIQKGKGIEVNTSGYALNKTCGFPNFDIVKRYKELGGTIITVGTDSHTSDRVGEHVEDVLKQYQEIGFDDVTTFTKRVKDN